jgi:proline iminopeptidase
MQESVYLGDLGGLTARRQLVLLDLRGTGESAVPDDDSSYRCDRLIDDVEALREHLGLDRVDLLAHSAGANVAARFVERNPAQVRRLVLVTPSTLAVGITITAETRLEAARLRRDEPWFPTSFAALERIAAGETLRDAQHVIAPFFYGRWDETARAHRAAQDEQTNREAAAVFGTAGAFDPDTTCAALASFEQPVLVVAGEVDLNSPPSAMAEVADLFPNAELVVQPGAGHFPWLDDADRFMTATAAFLG